MSPTEHFLYAAKTYCALIGSTLTTVIAILPHVPLWVTAVGVGLTAVATFTVPNATKEQLAVRKGSKASPYAQLPKAESKMPMVMPMPSFSTDSALTGSGGAQNIVSPDVPPAEPTPPPGSTD